MGEKTVGYVQALPGLCVMGHVLKLKRFTFPVKGNVAGRAAIILPAQFMKEGLSLQPSNSPSSQETPRAPLGTNASTSRMRLMWRSSGKCLFLPSTTIQAMGKARCLYTRATMRATQPPPTTLPSITNIRGRWGRLNRSILAKGRQSVAALKASFLRQRAIRFSRLATNAGSGVLSAIFDRWPLPVPQCRK